MSKQRRLGRGLEALLGRGGNSSGPQIHVPPEEESAKKDSPEAALSNSSSAKPEPSKPSRADEVTPIQVNQPARVGVPPRRVEPTRRPDSGISLETKKESTPPKPDTGTTPALSIASQAAAAKEPPKVEPPKPEPPKAEQPKAEQPKTTPEPPQEDAGTESLLMVDIHLIETNPFQPRTDFAEEELAQLSQSLKEHGLLQPLVVRRVDESYQLIAGERRLRAAQAAGWREVPVKVIEAGDTKVSELALVENLQRKDLNAMEKAASFKRYLKMVGCTQEELAKRLKLDRSTIANLIRLLELPEPVQAAVRQGKITQGHARALLPLGEEPKQIEFAQRVERESLSVRATERLVQETIDQEDHEPLAVVGRDGGSSKAKPKSKNEQLASLEQEFRSALGTKVKLTHSANGRGRLVIQFGSHDEFERLRRHILGTEPVAQQKAG